MRAEEEMKDNYLKDPFSQTHISGTGIHYPRLGKRTSFFFLKLVSTLALSISCGSHMVRFFFNTVSIMDYLLYLPDVLLRELIHVKLSMDNLLVLVALPTPSKFRDNLWLAFILPRIFFTCNFSGKLSGYILYYYHNTRITGTVRTYDMCTS
jgi:hypothetical protein